MGFNFFFRIKVLHLFHCENPPVCTCSSTNLFRVERVVVALYPFLHRRLWGQIFKFEFHNIHFLFYYICIYIYFFLCVTKMVDKKNIWFWLHLKISFGQRNEFYTTIPPHVNYKYMQILICLLESTYEYFKTI